MSCDCHVMQLHSMKRPFRKKVRLIIIENCTIKYSTAWPQVESVILGLADHALSVDPESLSTLTQRGSVHRFMNFSVSWKRKI